MAATELQWFDPADGDLWGPQRGVFAGAFEYRQKRWEGPLDVYGCENCLQTFTWWDEVDMHLEPPEDDDFNDPDPAPRAWRPGWSFG
ncbi:MULTISPECIES: hypothetical protein [unclassified Frankia]|uniref:hypothetical protein n=1 Tax=unclassified Frankia TaxID=2632575 RepID=UPI0012FA4206|nr:MULTISPECIES: hypothetical protein [unclassified Frankia]